MADDFEYISRVRDAIAITWDATLRVSDESVFVSSGDGDAASA